MSKSPESFIQRLKAMIAVNNILEVMDAVFVAQCDGVRLEGNELLKLAVIEKIKKLIRTKGTDTAYKYLKSVCPLYNR